MLGAVTDVRFARSGDVDIAYHVGNVFFEYYKEPRYAPPVLMRKMISAGHLGRKTGKGFYDYSEKAYPVARR